MADPVILSEVEGSQSFFPDTRNDTDNKRGGGTSPAPLFFKADAYSETGV